MSLFGIVLLLAFPLIVDFLVSVVAGKVDVVEVRVVDALKRSGIRHDA
ncbi:MAG: hypothetical protein Q7T01_04885 [bacterium]|nr:hypothetical protein [bacterium]